MTVESVAARLDVVRSRIERSGGADVQVMAVTKTWGVDAVLAASAAGCDSVGENYAQELAKKLITKLAQEPGGEAGIPPVHFIGRLQTNKVRVVAPFVDVYETVDRVSLAIEIARRMPGATVLVQVSTDADPHKSGCSLGDAPALVDTCRSLGLVVDGFMTVGPTEGGPEAARPGFRAVRALLDRVGLTVCSMGMSDDLEVAVQEGSTQIRVGSALFGERIVPQTDRRTGPRDVAPPPAE